VPELSGSSAHEIDIKKVLRESVEVRGGAGGGGGDGGVCVFVVEYHGFPFFFSPRGKVST